MAGFGLSGKARQDFRDISAYIGKDNPLAAGRFVENLEHRLEIVAELPLAGRSRDDSEPVCAASLSADT
jgi:plasmid stabilization system protein ParE